MNEEDQHLVGLSSTVYRALANTPKVRAVIGRLLSPIIATRLTTRQDGLSHKDLRPRKSNELFPKRSRGEKSCRIDV